MGSFKLGLAAIVVLLSQVTGADVLPPCLKPSEDVVISNSFRGTAKLQLCDESLTHGKIVIRGYSPSGYRSLTNYKFVAGGWSYYANIRGFHVYRIPFVSRVRQLRDFGLPKQVATSVGFFGAWTPLLGLNASEPIVAVDPGFTLALMSHLAPYLTDSAQLVTRLHNWRFERRPLTAIDWNHGLLSYDNSHEKNLILDYSESFGGHEWRLINTMPTTAGEWAWHDGHLYYAPQNGLRPADSQVEVTAQRTNNSSEIDDSILHIDLPVSFHGSLHVEDLGFDGSAGNGLTITAKAADVYVNNIYTNFTTDIGLYVDSRNVSVKTSRFHNSQTNGVALIAANILVENSDFLNNGRVGTQRNSGELGGLWLSPRERVWLKLNTIRGSGGHGIFLGGARLSAEVFGNQVFDSCLFTNDCAAIYISSSDVRPGSLNYVVSQNYIRNVVGNYQGMAGSQFRRMVAGVYLDFCAYGYTVSGNWIENAAGPGEVLADIYGLGLNSIYSNNVGGPILRIENGTRDQMITYSQPSGSTPGICAFAGL